MKPAQRIPGGPLVWRLGDGAPPSGVHVTLVPGALAPLLPLELPDKLRGAARERVAERQMVEHLSLATAGFEMRPFLPKGTKQFNAAVVVEAGLADAWRKGLAAGCSAMLPDYLGLPAANDLWSIDVIGKSVIARLGIGDGFTAEADLALALLAEGTKPRVILRLGDDNAAIDDFLSGLKVPIVTDAVALKKAGVTPLRWTDAAGGIDLKAAPSAGIEALRSRILRWRTPVVFGALALAAWLGTLFLETRDLRAEAVQNRQIALDLVKQHFVPSGPILDIRAQVTAAAETLREPEIIEIETLPALAQFQMAAPYMMADDLRLVAVSYRSDTGLVTSVEATDFAALDQFIASLQDADFLVEQLDSRAQQSGGVAARLQVELLQ